MSNNKDIVVAGCGYWGKNLIRNFHELNALAGVCDNNAEAAQQFAEQYDVKAYDWAEALADETIKSVVIATPAVFHYEMAKQALEAGKNVLVEKPMSLAEEEGQELCSVAKDSNLTLMVGHLLHYHAGYLKLKELVSDGTLGDINYIYSNRLNLGKIRREEDILWSFAPHDISMILDLMSEEPQNVHSDGGFHFDSDVADTTMTQLTFSQGRKAHIFVSWLHPFKEQKLVVVGSKAMAVFNDGLSWDQKLCIYEHQVNVDENNIPVPDKADPKFVDLSESEPLRAECQHFIDCVVQGQTPRTDGDEGLRVLKVLRAATESLKKQV